MPTQAEIVAQGSLAGPLSPIAPAEAEQYAAQVDQELRAAGFQDGLNTQFPSPEQALGRGLPGLIAAAKAFDEAKKKVKKARDENRKFAQAMQKWNHSEFEAAAQDFEEYIKAYPKSPWTPEAMIHVANYAKYTGRGNDAEDGYRRVIEMTSNDRAEMSYNAHRKAFGRLTDLYLIEGRYGEVRPMLKDLLNNDTNWSRRTWGLYWLTQINAITSNPKILLAERDCGTLTLAALLAQTDHPHQAREVKDLKPTDPRGFSLADLKSIAGQRNVSLVGFQGTPQQLTRVPMPALLHLGSKSTATPAIHPDDALSLDASLGAGGLEHFVLVRSYDGRRDVWNVLNPQDGTSAQFTSAQLQRQWSGRGLMMAHPPVKRAGRSAIPSFASGRVINASFSVASKPVQRLSAAQMSATFGTGYAVKGQSNLGDDPANIGIMGSCPAKGSPAVSINPMSQNVFITDIPVWYSPSKGPDVEITLSYNSLDASNHDRRVGGNKWSFNYGSYIVELPGKATVFMPDGAQVSFTQSSADSTRTYYTSPRGEFSTLVKMNSNSRYELTSPQGERMSYGHAVIHQQIDGPNGTVTETTAFLDAVTDRWGQSLTIERAAAGIYSVPKRIIDADGGVTILGYDEDTGRLTYAQTPDERQASFTYDEFGNMTQCVDVAGQGFQYAYDTMANVVQLNTIQGDWNFQYTHSFTDTENNEGDNFDIKVTNPDGKSRVVAFETKTSPETPGGEPVNHHHGYYYSSDYRGNRTAYKVVPLYDGSQLSAHGITQVKYPSSLVVDYAYDNNRVLEPTVASMPGLSQTTTFNSQGRPTQVVQTASSGAVRATNIAYYNNLDISQVVVSGKTSANAPYISQTLFRCNSYNHHQPEIMFDASGHRTDVTYNTIGNPVTVKTYEGSATHTATYNYGAAGDEANRLQNVVYDGVPMSAYDYDSSGRVIAATDVQTNLTTRYHYNNLDALVSTTYPDNTQELIDYTCCTLPGMVTDRSGRKTYYDYDVLKRMVRVQDAEGQTLQLNYDADGNQVSMLDALGQKTRWAYDETTRTVIKRYQDNKREIVHMAVQGWVDYSTSARGITSNYSYNNFGQLTGLDNPNSVYVGDYTNYNNYSTNSDVALSYDGLGRCIYMDDGTGNTDWAYDAQGRIVYEDGPFNNDTIYYGYDELDRIKSVQVCNSLEQTDINPESYRDTRTFNYDSLGRLSSVAAQVNAVSIGSFGFSYQGNSDRLNRIDRPNGTYTQYSYETTPMKRFLGVINKVSSTGATQSSFLGHYNSTNWRDSYSRNSRTYGDEAFQDLSYSFSATSMLKREFTSGLTSTNAGGTSSNPLVDIRYNYDAMGNRTQVRDGVAHKQIDSTYSALNQLLTRRTSDTSSGTPVVSSTTSLYYDGDGNQTSAVTQVPAGQVTGRAVYIYDAENRLVLIETPGVSKWQFRYDGLSRMRYSYYFLWDTDTGGWELQDEKRRVYQGMDVVQERDRNGRVSASVTRIGNIGGILARTTVGVTQATTLERSARPSSGARAGGQRAGATSRGGAVTRGSASRGAATPNRAARQVEASEAEGAGEPGADVMAAPPVEAGAPQAASAQTASGPVTTFFAGDNLGNVTTLTDTAGAVVGSYTYDSWGNLLASSGTRSAENPYRFSSKEQIGGGFYSFGYRFYNSSTGRWLNRDPIREDGGLNLYGFNYNNPVTFVDPNGACPWLATAAVGAAVGGGIGAGVAWWNGGSTRDILIAGGKGAVVGAIAGATGGMAGTAVSTAGGGFWGGAAAGAVSGAAGDAASQGAEMALGWRQCYDWKQTAMAAGTGGLMGGVSGAKWLCFAKGTQVVMADGSTKAIEEVKVGDKVQSRDEASGQTEAKPVKRLFERQVEATLVLHFSNGERIETTKEHPFYVEGRGFTPAGEMGIGTSIVTRAGPSVKLTRVELKNAATTVYNFEVEEFHTYFVGSSDGGLWVHNDCFNRGGRFSAVDDLKVTDEVGHHMPQNASLPGSGLSRGSGPALGMTKADHARTRTFSGRGKATMRTDAGLSLRQRLDLDIADIRSLFGDKYDRGIQELLNYANGLSQF